MTSKIPALIILLFIYINKCYAYESKNDNLIPLTQALCFETAAAFPSTTRLIINNNYAWEGFKYFFENGARIKIYFRTDRPSFVSEVLISQETNILLKFRPLIGLSTAQINAMFGSAEEKSQSKLVYTVPDTEEVIFYTESNLVTSFVVKCAAFAN